MQDWVYPYLKKNGAITKVTETTWNGFAQADNDGFECYDWVLAACKGLMKNLNHNFKCQSEDKERLHDIFITRFGRTLANLPKDKFLKLCSQKNVFYVFNPDERVRGYVKGFYKPNNQEDGPVRVVVFRHKILSMSHLASRFCIVHELVHVIEGLKDSDEDEKRVDEIAREWGFEKEYNEWDEHYKRGGQS